MDENEKENEREEKKEKEKPKTEQLKIDLFTLAPPPAQTLASPREKRKKYSISIPKIKKKEKESTEGSKSPKMKRKLFSARGGNYQTPKEISENIRKYSNDNIITMGKTIIDPDEIENEEKDAKKANQTINNNKYANSNEIKEEENEMTVELREGRQTTGMARRKSLPKLFSENMKKKISTKLTSSNPSIPTSKTSSPTSSSLPSTSPITFSELNTKKTNSDTISPSNFLHSNECDDFSSSFTSSQSPQVQFHQLKKSRALYAHLDVLCAPPPSPLSIYPSNDDVTLLENEKIVNVNFTRLKSSDDQISVVIGDRLKVELPPVNGFCFAHLADRSGFVPLHVSSDLLLLLGHPLEREVDTSSLISSKEENKINLKKSLEVRPMLDFLIQKNILTPSSPSFNNSAEEAVIDPAMVEERAIKLFAEKPVKAIDLLINHKLLEKSPQVVADYLFNTPLLSPDMIGDYLSERGDFYSDTLHCYLDHLNFKDMEFDQALRAFLYTFKLPGESQKIDRIVEAFAKKYFEQYSGTLFAHSDTVYILAFATIMLNTDLHNIYVKKKMTSAEFVNNNRDINQGKSLPTPFLLDLYQRILEDEIKTKGVGHFPKAIKRGFLQFKKGKSKGARHWIILDKDSNHLYSFKLESDTTPTARFNLHYLTVIQQESTIKISSKKNFTILLDYIEDGRTVHITLSTPSQRLWVEWLTCISDAIEEANRDDD